MKDWTGSKSTPFVTMGASNHSTGERHSEDFYATEPSAIDDLFKVESFSPRIWEPACGQGHLSKRMIELGKDVYSTDLVDRGYGDTWFDFLHYGEYFTPCCRDAIIGRSIITNPPYSKAQEFCEQAIKLTGDKVAMFLKLTFLEGQTRAVFFKQYPPKTVYVFSKRKNCVKNGEFKKGYSSAIAFAWFVWVKGWHGKPEIEWI